MRRRSTQPPGLLASARKPDPDWFRWFSRGVVVGALAAWAGVILFILWIKT